MLRQTIRLMAEEAKYCAFVALVNDKAKLIKAHIDYIKFIGIRSMDPEDLKKREAQINQLIGEFTTLQNQPIPATDPYKQYKQKALNEAFTIIIENFEKLKQAKHAVKAEAERQAADIARKEKIRAETREREEEKKENIKRLGEFNKRKVNDDPYIQTIRQKLFARTLENDFRDRKPEEKIINNGDLDPWETSEEDRGIDRGIFNKTYDVNRGRFKK